MILKGSQRGGGRALARHLMNVDDNEHVTVHELRGFAAENFTSALLEVENTASYTHCKKMFYSLSLNPPKTAEVSIQDFEEAIDAAEQTLGLSGQPRAIVLHEKGGRFHAHCVWSRIEIDKMKAINIYQDWPRLKALSRDLYLKHGWDLPEGFKPDGKPDPNNYSREEAQIAKRTGVDPAKAKQIIRQAYEQSDSLQALEGALAVQGFALCNGRRSYLALDIYTMEPIALTRATGEKLKAIRAKLGASDTLPDIEQVKAAIAERKNAIPDYRPSPQPSENTAEGEASQEPEALSLIHKRIAEVKDQNWREMQDMRALHKEIISQQRKERLMLENRQQMAYQISEKKRAKLYHHSLIRLFDFLTGGTILTEKRDARERQREKLVYYKEWETLRQQQEDEIRDLYFQKKLMRERHQQLLILLRQELAAYMRHHEHGMPEISWENGV